MIDILKARPHVDHLFNSTWSKHWLGVESHKHALTHTHWKTAHSLPLSLSLSLCFSLFPQLVPAYKTPQPYSGWIGWFGPLVSLGFVGLISHWVSPSFPLSLNPAWNRIVWVVVFTVNGWLRCVGKRDFLWNSSLSLWNLKQLLEKWTQKRSLHCWIACDLLGVFPVISLVWVAAPPGHCWTPGQKGSYFLSPQQYICHWLI